MTVHQDKLSDNPLVFSQLLSSTSAATHTLKKYIRCDKKKIALLLEILGVDSKNLFRASTLAWYHKDKTKHHQIKPNNTSSMPHFYEAHLKGEILQHQV